MWNSCQSVNVTSLLKCYIRQHSFLEFGHEINLTAILSLLLIQEGQLSVTGERMCTKYTALNLKESTAVGTHLVML